MTSLLKRLSIRKGSKPFSSKDKHNYSTAEVTNQYDDYDERYEQRYRQAVEAQKASQIQSRPALNVMPGIGTPGNAGRHPSQYGLGDIPIPEAKLERDLELDERVEMERKSWGWRGEEVARVGGGGKGRG